MNADTEYLAFLDRILANGEQRDDRTGTGTVGVFGERMRFDLSAEFPLLTTKRVFFKGVAAELLWFLSGSDDVRVLQKQGVGIWDEWADADGRLGRIYGPQWRSWRGADGKVVDQIAGVIAGLKTDPYGRRHLISAWNPAELSEARLPPCHVLFQFYVSTDGRLSCQLYQRSADAVLGVPFNIASYALLTVMIAQVCGLTPGEFVWVGGDCHVYRNHLDAAREQLGRAPRPAPRLIVNPAVTDIDGFTLADFMLSGYDPHPAIKAAVSV